MSKLIRGSFGGGSSSGGSAHTPKESPDSIRSKQFARVVDLVCEGEIEGLVDSLKSVYLDDTPLQNADLTYNFSDVTVNTRNGTQNQTYIDGFPSAEAETAVGVQVTFSTSVTRQITNQNINRVRVSVSLPSLYQQQTNGDVTGATVEYAIDVQTNGGGYVEQLTTTISDKTTSKYIRSHEITLTGTAPWDIRVRRVTADSGSASLQNSTYFESYTEIIDSKLSYPNSAIVGIEIDASQFSRIPTRSYDLKLLKVRIPSNYNPLTRVYTGVWDGTFTTAWTDNPAWCFYDLLTNSRYGLGSYIDSSLVDTAELYTIGQYCDELVNDGFGSTEPRFTCNLYLQTREEAVKVISNMASIFRGMVYWSTGSIFAVQDAPADTFAQFTNADVIDGMFNYSGSAATTRHSVALVTWNDPSDAYKQKIEYVEDQTSIARYGVRETELVAIGCTSRGQAHRMGKWLLYSERYETEAISFKTSFKGAYCTPGKIIQTMDSSRAGVRFGGRVISSTTTAVTIDAAVTIESGKTYTLNLVMPDGSIVERTLNNSVGSTTVLTFASALATQPQDYSVWVLAASDLSAEKWRVLSSVEDEKHIYTINAVKHYDQKFDAVEENISFEVPNTTYLQTDQDPVTEIVVTDSLYYLTQDILGVKMLISWNPPSGAVRYEVNYKTEGQNFVTVPSTVPSVEALNVSEGVYDISIVAFNILGVPSVTATTTYTVLGKTAAPSNVSNFAINVIGENSHLSWDAVSDLDLSHYQIRFSGLLVGANWSSANILVEKVGKPATSITVPTLVGTYLIKAVDYYDNSSIAETTIITNINAINGFNAITTVTEDPSFSGTKTDVTVVSSELQLSTSGGLVLASGEYEFNNSVDLGAVYTSRLMGNIVASGVDINSNMDSWTTLASIESLDNSVASGWSLQLQVRTTNDDPAGTPTWSDWKNLVVGDYSARAFEFKLIMYSFETNVTPSVSTLEVIVDMPDRVYGANDVVAGTTGLTVTYSPAFKESPALAISAQGLTTGDYYVITSKSETGFTIIFRDSGGSAIERTFDYVAKGWGYVI